MKNDTDWVENGLTIEDIELLAAMLVNEPYTMVAHVRMLPATRTWTNQEDSRLLVEVGKHGKLWRSAAKALNHRSDDSCRQRYTRLTMASVEQQPERKHRLRRFSWTTQEDELLKTHMNAGLGWKELAQLLPGRTARGVRNRVYRLTTLPVSTSPYQPLPASATPLGSQTLTLLHSSNR